MKTYKKKRFWAATLVVQILLFYVFSMSGIMISLFENFFEVQKWAHQILFAWIPFSIGDVMYILLGLLILYYLVKCCKKTSRSNAVLKLLFIINIFYFIYQVFWGMLYFQTPIIKKLSQQQEPDLNKAKQLALRYLDQCKLSRELVKEDKNGVFVVTDLQAVQREILAQQQKLPKYISDKKGIQINAFKPSIFKNVMSFTGILGYYNPFTAEAQYNAELPSTFIPFTTAHESSHQLGFAREQEANFIGYLMGVHSENIELRYSTEYFTLKSLLRFIIEKDPDFVESVLKNYSPAMKRDRLYEKSFVLKHQGWLDDFFGMTNNLFLKSNQQEGSITYSYFIDLLLNYEN